MRDFREIFLEWIVPSLVSVGTVLTQEILLAAMNGLGLNGTAEGETDAEA